MIARVVTVVLALAATPAVALSVSTSSCNGHSAELTGGDAGWSLRVEGREVALPPAFEWEGLRCLGSGDGVRFGLIGVSSGGEASPFVVTPGADRLEPVPPDEAEALGFGADEDGWDLGDD